LVVELTSSMADAWADAPELLIATPCAKAVPAEAVSKVTKRGFNCFIL